MVNLIAEKEDPEKVITLSRVGESGTPEKGVHSYAFAINGLPHGSEVRVLWSTTHATSTLVFYSLYVGEIMLTTEVYSREQAGLEQFLKLVKETLYHVYVFRHRHGPQPKSPTDT
jgi:hypothetical protein